MAMLQMNLRNRRPWQPLLGDKKTFWGDQNKNVLLAVCLGPKLIFRNGVALATNVSVSYSVSNIVPYGAGPDTTKHSNVYMTPITLSSQYDAIHGGVVGTLSHVEKSVV